MKEGRFSVSKNEKGSAGVIEMSLVLPMTMFVVISLIYLTFSMFLYVHLQGVAEVAADSLESAVVEASSLVDIGSFSEKIVISAETEGKLRDEFDKKLQSLCMLPGMSANFDFNVEMKGINPEITVKMECTCFKVAVFTALVERKVYFPKEFANNMDLIFNIFDKTGTLVYAKERLEEVKEAYEEIF